MIRTLATALLALGAAALQEEPAGKLDPILARLNDDSVEVRDGALKDLVALGPAALPLLRARMDSVPGEVRGRIEEACRRIESAAALARVLPPLRRITLDAKDRPLKELLDEIARQGGLALDLSSGGFEGKLSLTLRDALPLQALDAACRASTGIQYQILEDEADALAGFRRRRRGAPPAGARIALQAGTWTDYPACYVRHYRVRATQVALNRVNAFDGVQRTGQLSLDLQWPPDVKPDRLLRFRVTELKDDQGRSLLNEGAPEEGFRDRIRRGWGVGTQHSLQFKYPEAGARAIGLLRGEVSVEFPKDVRVLSFEKPAESKGKSLEVDGLKLALKDYKNEGKNHTVVLDMTGRIRGADPDPEDHGYPISWEDVEVVGESGERLSQGGMSGGGGNNQFSWTLNYNGTRNEPAKEVRIRCILSRHPDEFTFEIRDIRFPE